MKKKVSIAVATIVGALVLGLGIYQSNASQGSPNLSTDDIRQMVLDQYPGTITEIEFETDFNKSVYEVEVVSNGKEYDLKLDGNTGEVLKLKEKSISSKEKEKVVLENNDDEQKINDDQKVNEEQEQVSDDSGKAEKVEKENNKKESSQTNKQKASDKKTVIDSKKAIEIAQDAFDGSVSDLELDKEDGRLIYEIELKSGNEEAEIEIDAYTGEILVIEIDIDKSSKYQSKGQSSKTIIDAQKAIDIAQGAFDGRVTDLELDKEDGRLIYEIELKSGNQEAEIEIDAYTGEIFVIEIED